MTPADWIALLVIVLIVGGATAYIIKAKKNGKRCIGCPDSDTCQAHKANETESESTCGGNCSSCCHCNHTKNS